MSQSEFLKNGKKTILFRNMQVTYQKATLGAKYPGWETTGQEVPFFIIKPHKLYLLFKNTLFWIILDL